MSQKYIWMTIVIAVVVGVAGFFGGVQYQKGKTPAVTARTGGFGGTGGFAGRGGVSAAGGANSATGNIVTGTVLSESNGMMTVQLRSGSSRIVLYSSSTPVSKMAPGSVSDVTTGQTVLITGTTNQDGSLAATNISLNPGFGGADRPGASPTPTSAQ